MKLYSEVPYSLFEQAGVDSLSEKLVLASLICDAVLTGNNNLELDGETYHLGVMNERKKFKVPTSIFIMFAREQDCIDSDEFLIYLYLCYVADKTRNHQFKLQFDVAAKKFDVSKKKFKDIVAKIESNDILDSNFIVIKNNHFTLPILEKSAVQQLEMIENKTSLKEMFSDIPIPDDLFDNYKNYNMSLKERNIVMQFLRFGYPCSLGMKQTMQLMENMFHINEEQVLETVEKYRQAANNFTYEVNEKDFLCVQYTDSVVK